MKKKPGPKIKVQKKICIGIALRPMDIKELNRLAKQLGISRSQWIVNKVWGK